MVDLDDGHEVRTYSTTPVGPILQGIVDVRYYKLDLIKPKVRDDEVLHFFDAHHGVVLAVRAAVAHVKNLHCRILLVYPLQLWVKF